MKITLLRKFSILSFMVITFLGIVLGMSFSKYFQRQLMVVEARHLADFVDMVVSFSMNPEDFSGPITGRRYDTLYSVIKSNILADDIKRVKIWNREGNIIFSDDINLIGIKLKEQKAIQESLSGGLAVGFAKHNDLIGTGYNIEDKSKEFVQVSVPIKLTTSDGRQEVFGVFELYQEATPLYQLMLQGQRFGWFFIGISFLALYISLYQIVKKASRTIEDQDNALVDLTDRLDTTMKNQEETYVGTIKALLTALDAKDKYTAGHCSRVTDYAVMIGRAMNLDGEQLRNIEEAGLFHDIGKIGIPESILNKTDTLTTEEFEFIKKHSAIGATIIESISYFAQQSDIVRHHHERWDGRGYPDNLAGTDIPLEARVLSVADTYDAMTSDRPYRARMAKEKAISIIEECSGSQFDPLIVNAFLKVIK